MPRSVMTDDTPLRPVPALDEEPPTGVDATTGEILTGVSPGLTAVNSSYQPGYFQPGYGLGNRQQIEDELDAMARAIRQFNNKQPDQVMRECAAYTARLTELCVLLHRVETLDRQYTRVRTQQVERWLQELERQFKIASRLIEVMRQDLALSGAAT